jgi:hypothetical protein
MDIFQINELTDEMMDLCDDNFYDFLQASLNKDLCELFRVQTIRDMSSLSSIIIDQIIDILTVEVTDLNNLRKSLGFVTTDGHFHLRLGHRNRLERLLALVKSKKNSINKNIQLSNKPTKDQLQEKLLELWKQTPNSTKETNTPILFPWISNIFKNLKKNKNKYNYDDNIREFAVLIFIFGGRNSYEFLRLNLPAALPHVSNLELLIRN